jgi:hypothetical protein
MDHIKIIDVDSIELVATQKSQSESSKKHAEEAELSAPCYGILVLFPAGKTHHTSYPFGIHGEQPVPWNYHSIDDRFFVQARDCKKGLVNDERNCSACGRITSYPRYQGIIERIHHGVHENTPLVYHPHGNLTELVRRKAAQVQQLRLVKLNDTRKLLGKAAALDDHKPWIMAIASGKVERVTALVQAGLKNNAGVRGLIRAYERATLGLYRPKGYTEDDIMRSIVMLRLGGSRVADFAHRSLSLPSVTTARRNTVIRPLTVSPAMPTITEVEANITACLEAVPQHGRVQILHQVLMFDELALEQRPRWNDLTNQFVGTCREHGDKVPLEFNSERELDLFCNAIEDGQIHLASEVQLSSVVHFLF